GPGEGVRRLGRGAVAAPGDFFGGHRRIPPDRGRCAPPRRLHRARGALPSVPPAAGDPLAHAEPGEPPADRAAAAPSRDGGREAAGGWARGPALVHQLHRGGVWNYWLTAARRKP